MPRLKNSTPKYRHHKATGQAIVTLDGQEFYLGPNGSRPSPYTKDSYRQAIHRACDKAFPADEDCTDEDRKDW